MDIFHVYPCYYFGRLYRHKICNVEKNDIKGSKMSPAIFIIYWIYIICYIYTIYWIYIIYYIYTI